MRFWMILSWCGFATVAFGHRHHRSDDAAASAPPGQFDYYLLSLSWSPSYCLTHSTDRDQCTKGFGFVLHGLWPQNFSGSYPEDCAADAALTPAAAALGRTLFPSAQLMQHEWQRHGTCSGLSAERFFQTADRALASIRVPPAFEAPRLDFAMDTAQIAAAFRAANPSLPSDGLAIACNRDRLSEVRVCLRKDLALARCGRGVRSHCPAVSLSIPAAR